MPPWAVNDNHGTRLTGHGKQRNKQQQKSNLCRGAWGVEGGRGLAGRWLSGWGGRVGGVGPSAGARGCQHKLTQVVLAPSLEQHGAVFSLLCSTLLRWDNVRVLILYAEGRKNSTFSFFFVLFYFSVSPLYLSLCVVVLQGQVSKYFIPVTSFCAKVTRGGRWVIRALLIVTDRCAAPTFNFLLLLWAARSSCCIKRERTMSRAVEGRSLVLKAWQTNEIKSLCPTLGTSDSGSCIAHLALVQVCLDGEAELWPATVLPTSSAEPSEWACMYLPSSTWKGSTLPA